MNRTYNAKVYINTGLGLEVASISASNYIRLKEEVRGLLSINNMKVNSNGYEAVITISKVVYSFPSGKKYIKVLV